jgi:hypothetical protein
VTTAITGIRQRRVPAVDVLVEVPGPLVPAHGLQDLRPQVPRERSEHDRAALAVVEPVEPARVRASDEDAQV